MDNVTLRRGRPEDANDFAELALLTGPELLPALFGPAVRKVWGKAFQHPGSCFSHEHSHFIEVNGKIAGMAQAYGCKHMKKEELRSLLFILRYLKWGVFKQLIYLFRSSKILARISADDYYLSNIATYPEYRGRGYGIRLIEAVEGEALAAQYKRLVLDVETDNERAIKFYERQEYTIDMKSPVLKTRDRDFEFFKMSKGLTRV